MFTVKPDPGIVAKSFKSGDAFYIGDEKLLPLSRFTNPGKPSGRYVYFLQATCICSLRSILVKTFSHFFKFQFISEEVDVEEDAVAEGMQRTLRVSCSPFYFKSHFFSFFTCSFNYFHRGGGRSPMGGRGGGRYVHTQYDTIHF
jgi:hypothetical protein